MIQKSDTIISIAKSKLIAILRIDNSDILLRTRDVLIKEGIRILEIPFTVPHAATLIEQCRNDEYILGAGSILDPETARIAILSGANFIVGQAFSKKTALMCNRYAIPYFPGVMTPRDIHDAMEYGAEVLKLFPGSLFSPASIATLQAPFPYARFMPTGGVTLDTAQSWLDAGAVALGIGSDLIRGCKTQDYRAVQAQARAYLACISKQ